MPVDLILIGYLLKRITRPAEWLAALGVREIASAGYCLAQPPDDWVARWTHNAMWLYSTRAAALALVPEGERNQFRLYAYRVFPTLFDQGTEAVLPIPELDVEPVDETFQPLGFDVVSRSAGTTFECSPLSCNDEATQTVVNEFCLMPDLPSALSAAATFSLDEPEPGPYVVVEVLAACALN